MMPLAQNTYMARTLTLIRHGALSALRHCTARLPPRATTTIPLSPTTAAKIYTRSNTYRGATRRKDFETSYWYISLRAVKLSLRLKPSSFKSIWSWQTILANTPDNAAPGYTSAWHLYYHFALLFTGAPASNRVEDVIRKKGR